MHHIKTFFFLLLTLYLTSALAADSTIIITKETMKNCALSIKNADDFTDCCLNHSFKNNDSQEENIVSENPSTNDGNSNSGSLGTITIQGGGSSKELYNKNDAVSARPLFSYTWTYDKKQCSAIGNLNQYDWCICNNGGDFRNHHCWCPMGAWQKNGQCICQPGTTKYEFYTGPSNSQKTFNCRNDEYENPYTFSDASDYTSPAHDKYNDPDYVDWDDPLSVFWYHYNKSGKEVGMTFTEAFEKQNNLNKRKEPKKIPKITIWKAFGITATNGTQEYKIDVVGNSRCITPDANLDDNTGAQCVCSIKSVSTGSIQEKWVYNPLASFYFVLQYDRSPEGICRTICSSKCAEAFANGDYNVRYSLMKHWKP